MRIGEFKFKKRYSVAQILVDVFSVGVLVYIGYMIYVCAADIEYLKSLNRTDADMSIFDWRPLIVWEVLGLVIFGLSVFLMLKKKNKPKKYFITKNNVRKYCNIIDTCIACIRLVLLLAVSELCYYHVASILMREAGFSVQLVFDAVIIVGILMITRLRLQAISEPEEEKAQNERAERTLTED